MDKYLGTKFGEINLEKLKNFDTNLYNQIIKTKNNSITLVYLHNFNSQGDLPFTGWIIAHRFAHSVAFNKKMGGNGVHPIEHEIADKFNSIISKGYGMDNTYAPLGKKQGDKKSFQLLMNILTMKSARDKKMSASFEFFPETFTQYLLTGSVKFNNLPKEGFVGDEKQYQLLNNEMQTLSHDMGKMYENLLQSCVGKVFTF